MFNFSGFTHVQNCFGAKQERQPFREPPLQLLFRSPFPLPD
jgi:hypothetical protein